jgi:DNA modification methylase
MIEKQSNLDDYHTFMQENTELPYYIKFRENGEKVIYGSFWTNKQRGGNSIQEISYRACFKPQLPEYFLSRYSKPGDLVLDPFSGRGTTAVESALLGRIPISNDINPISKILTEPRLTPPKITEIQNRLSTIPTDTAEAEIDLSMFYEKRTEREIISLRNYLAARKEEKKEDGIDKWIRMVATNRLSGHSRGFFSVYTLPPNQAATQEEQIRINRRLNQEPEYRNTKQIILKKSRTLLKDMTPDIRMKLFDISKNAIFLERDSRNLEEIKDNYVDITITSPPFINLVDYVKDNWLRLWFNCYDSVKFKDKVTILKKLSDWSDFIKETLRELYRVTKYSGHVAFEVGETKNANLSEIVYALGKEVGFSHLLTFINTQTFTKTSNIWGVDNNKKGTNTNQIVLFQKKEA